MNGIKPISSNPSRIQRIARGSGNSIGEVNEMLGEYKKMEKMVTKMKKANFGKGGQDIPGVYIYIYIYIEIDDEKSRTSNGEIKECS